MVRAPRKLEGGKRSTEKTERKRGRIRKKKGRLPSSGIFRRWTGEKRCKPRGGGLGLERERSISRMVDNVQSMKEVCYMVPDFGVLVNWN